MLTGEGKSSVFMYNGLKDDFLISKVIIEEKSDKKKLLKKRVKRLGYFKVIGQVLFQITVPNILERSSQKRIREIKSIYNLDSIPIPKNLVYNVNSVNSVECIEFIRNQKPDLIIVNGTRIISKKVLNCISATFVNTHAGITPKYRGVHGGYWALANDDRNNCGVTVHLVDSGIDTGGVLYQSKILPTGKDNFATYTYHQIGEGIIIMKKAITDFLNSRLRETIPSTAESKLWYHPTIWTYLYNRIIKGVK